MWGVYGPVLAVPYKSLAGIFLILPFLSEMTR